MIEISICKFYSWSMSECDLSNLFDYGENLLEAIFGDSYSITFGDGLVTVKPQPVTYDLSLLVFHYE